MKIHAFLSSLAVAAFCLTLAPLPAAADDEPSAQSETGREELTKAERKKLAAEKRAARKKAARAKAAFKWFRSEKSALAFGKKHNLPVWIVYSDPATCPVCVAFEKEILDNTKLKRSKGIGCGYISGAPLPKYQCTGKPSGAIVSPDGKVMSNLSYFRGWGVDEYIGRMKKAADELEAASEAASDAASE